MTHPTTSPNDPDRQKQFADIQAQVADVRHELDKFKSNAKVALAIIGLVGLAGAYQFFHAAQSDLIQAKLTAMDKGTEEVRKAKEEVDKLKDILTSISSKEGDSGVLQVGDVQICWGQMEVARDQEEKERKLTARFSEPFGAAPKVALGIRPDGTPIVWSTDGVFDKESITTSGYAGFLLGIAPDPAQGNGFSRAEVRVDYIAVGKRPARP